MTEQIINIDGIEITLFKSARAKSLNITIKPFTGVRVSVPQSVSLDKAKTAIRQRIGWVKNHLSKMQKAEGQFTHFSPSTKFSTRHHKLELKKGNVKSIKVSVKDDKIVALYKDLNVLDSNPSQLEIRKAIEHAWKVEAKEYLPNRVSELANKHDFKFKRVSVRNAKTRWGSCSVDNNINLSLHLMRLPDYLIDYVILHELVHTKIKNHSPHFWQLLDQVSGNARKLDREVKEYRIQIY